MAQVLGHGSRLCGSSTFSFVLRSFRSSAHLPSGRGSGVRPSARRRSSWQQDAFVLAVARNRQYSIIRCSSIVRGHGASRCNATRRRSAFSEEWSVVVRSLFAFAPQAFLPWFSAQLSRVTVVRLGRPGNHPVSLDFSWGCANYIYQPTSH